MFNFEEAQEHIRAGCLEIYNVLKGVSIDSSNMPVHDIESSDELKKYNIRIIRLWVNNTASNENFLHQYAYVYVPSTNKFRFEMTKDGFGVTKKSKCTFTDISTEEELFQALLVKSDYEIFYSIVYRELKKLFPEEMVDGFTICEYNYQKENGEYSRFNLFNADKFGLKIGDYNA